MENKPSIVILCGGGPAPGINTVISAVSKAFLKSGYRVIGLNEGYKNLFEKEQNTVEIDFNYADNIFNRGGSALTMSRYKPKAKGFDEETDKDKKLELDKKFWNDFFATEFFVKNNIKLLVTIGGDDTASTANRISEYLSKNNISIKNIHVPKTIDNDLPLPEGISTFGYQSAKDEGVRIGNAVYEDARTSAQWFVVSAMGRSAGHLAFGIGAGCHFPMIIIPEMFDKTPITLDKIVRMVISSIIKRRIMGVPYGAAVISEGVFHSLSDDEINSTGINFSIDAHGHPELGKVSKAHIFSELVDKQLAGLNLCKDIKIRPVELGYELRCIAPKAFDLMYCNLLGMGVKILFDKGITGAMVSADVNGNIRPLLLKDLADPTTNKIEPRLVNINGSKAQIIYRHALHYITPDDYDAAKKYLPNPEDFDFIKLLNW